MAGAESGRSDAELSDERQEKSVKNQVVETGILKFFLTLAEILDPEKVLQSAKRQMHDNYNVRHCWRPTILPASM